MVLKGKNWLNDVFLHELWCWKYLCRLSFELKSNCDQNASWLNNHISIVRDWNTLGNILLRWSALLCKNKNKVEPTSFPITYGHICWAGNWRMLYSVLEMCFQNTNCNGRAAFGVLYLSSLIHACRPRLVWTFDAFCLWQSFELCFLLFSSVPICFFSL